MYQRRLGLGNDLRTVQFTSSLINAMMCMHSHHFGDDYDDYDDDDEHESDDRSWLDLSPGARV